MDLTRRIASRSNQLVGTRPIYIFILYRDHYHNGIARSLYKYEQNSKYYFSWLMYTKIVLA